MCDTWYKVIIIHFIFKWINVYFIEYKKLLKTLAFRLSILLLHNKFKNPFFKQNLGLFFLLQIKCIIFLCNIRGRREVTQCVMVHYLEWWCCCGGGGGWLSKGLQWWKTIDFRLIYDTKLIFCTALLQVSYSVSNIWYVFSGLPGLNSKWRVWYGC